MARTPFVSCDLALEVSCFALSTPHGTDCPVAVTAKRKLVSACCDW